MERKLSKLKSKEQDESIPYFKLILIGENKVGKTQILHRLNNEKFDEKYSPTFGIDFRIISINEEKSKLKYDLQILDIAGQSDKIHLDIEKNFINDADAFLCLFSLEDQFSLDRAIKIVESYKSQIKVEKDEEDGKGGKVAKNGLKKWYLLGNKKDLDKKREAVPFSYKSKFDNYFEVSAKYSKNEEFNIIIDTIVHDLFLSKNESKYIDYENNMTNNDSQIDFIKSHGELFNEECKII